jgi:hypothetical protein
MQLIMPYDSIGCSMESVDTPSYEKIAFIAYNIGVYESVQKFGGLITSGKISSNTDVSKVAELLSESIAFYDAEMISQLINAMLRHRQNSTIGRITATEVKYVMNQLKAVGVSIP